MNSESVFAKTHCAPLGEEEHITEAPKAYEAMLPRANALTESELLRISIDIDSALNDARQVAARVTEELLPKLDTDAVDTMRKLLSQLTMSTLALRHAHTAILHADSESNDPLAPLLERLYKLRAIALAELPPLANRGFLEQAVIDQIVDGRGRDDLLSDLYALNTVFTKLRAKLGDRLWFTPADQEELNVGASALENAIVRQGVRGGKDKENSEMRVRMYTLFINDYDQLRRYVTFYRWSNRDAEVIAPSLFAKNTAKKSSKSESKDPNAPKDPADSLPEDKRDDMARAKERQNNSNNAGAMHSNAPVFEKDESKPVPQDDPFGRK